MKAAILDHARAMGGVFATCRLERVGAGPSDLRRLVEGGELVRVRHGAFVLADRWSQARPTERLALKTRAVMAGRDDAVAAGPSALALHQVPVWGTSTDQVVLHGDVNRVRTRQHLTLLPRSLPADGVEVVQGVASATIAYAVAQLCTRAGHEVALVSLDAALHERQVTLAQVRAVVDGGDLAMGSRQEWHARRMLERADPKCESVGETRTRLLLQNLGYAPRSQVALSSRDGFVGRVDFLVNDAVVVEFDGMVKYDGADGRAALIAEKRREDRLRALGFIVVRLTWTDLDRPERVAEMMSPRPTGGGEGR